MDTSQPNSPDRIHRVRRRGDTWHVTKADGSTVVVPNVNTGGYQSRVSFGFAGGALVSRRVTR